jgi:dihydroflavonol-4-reductase
VRRVLITGGTGFIGSRLALTCVESGDQVRVLGQTNTPAEEENQELLADRGVEVLLGSVTDAGMVLDAVEGRDLVFHLAAAQHEMNVPDRHFHDVNVEGTRNVMKAVESAGPGRVVHGSTIGVYGDPNGRIDEESPSLPVNIYGRTKLEAEKTALSYGDRIPVVVVRIPEVYGPGDRRLLKLFRAVDRGRFFIIGTGENLHHPIYVFDLIEGLLAAATSSHAWGEVLLLAGRDAVTTREMVDAVAESVNRPPPRFRLPMFPFVVAALAMEGSLRPLGIQPPLHRRRLDFFRKSFELSGEKAARLLGSSPRTSFREGARETAAWYRERGLL